MTLSPGLTSVRRAHAMDGKACGYLGGSSCIPSAARCAFGGAHELYY